MGASTHHLGQASVGWEGYGGGVRVFVATRVGCIESERVPLEDSGVVSDGEEWGPGPP